MNEVQRHQNRRFRKPSHEEYYACPVIQSLRNNVYLFPSLRLWRTTVASCSSTTSGPNSGRKCHVLPLQTSAQCLSQARPGASASALSPRTARRHQHICLWHAQVHTHCRTCWDAQKVNKQHNKYNTKGLFLLGGCAPVLEKLVPAGNGSRVSVFWSWQPGRKKTAGAELLRHYVIEWADEPAAELQWQTVEKNRNSTVITGEKPLWLLSPDSSKTCTSRFQDFTRFQFILHSVKCSRTSTTAWIDTLYL